MRRNAERLNVQNSYAQDFGWPPLKSAPPLCKASVLNKEMHFQPTITVSFAASCNGTTRPSIMSRIIAKFTLVDDLIRCNRIRSVLCSAINCPIRSCITVPGFYYHLNHETLSSLSSKLVRKALAFGLLWQEQVERRQTEASPTRVGHLSRLLSVEKISKIDCPLAALLSLVPSSSYTSHHQWRYQINMANPTSIYIDLVPGYKNLSSCAEAPLSSLVRNMWNGCGDNSELTSFSCFCTDSYSKFSWDISTAVVASCGLVLGPVQATSAVSVFHNYCANGTTQLVTATATTSGTASITNCKYDTKQLRS